MNWEKVRATDIWLKEKSKKSKNFGKTVHFGDLKIVGFLETGEEDVRGEEGGGKEIRKTYIPNISHTYH